jgi:hypothetical protein
VVAQKKSMTKGSTKKVAVEKAATDKTLSLDEGNDDVMFIDRRTSRGRRNHEDRRSHKEPIAVEHRVLERRVKVNRRRQIDPTTCERDYTPDEVEFMGALDEYKRLNGRMFPTCSEVLEVLKKLGYEKRPPVEPAASAPAVELAVAVAAPQPIAV